MGKSSHNFDKGVPKHNVKNINDEDFDWREELRKREIEEEEENKLEEELMELDSEEKRSENDNPEE